MKTILLTGANGQLGYELQRSAPQHINIIPCDAKELDITDPTAIEQFFHDYHKDGTQTIHAIINAAAYTAVDKAESEQEQAYLVNEHGAANLAKVAHDYQIPCVHISTDFVFSGQQSSPYLPDTATEPQSIYGASKWAGEQQVRTTLPEQHLIIRTSWLYSAHGHNFVKTMLRLMQSKPRLSIVADQIGTPTWAHTLATTVWTLFEKNARGTFHCSDNGVASWYDFAIAIQTIALQKGLLHEAIPIHAIRSEDYPTAAKRPPYSVMDKRKTEQTTETPLPHWQHSLAAMLDELQTLSKY
jgi:dTDP-4-dehydrorhamnose reductase